MYEMTTVMPFSLDLVSFRLTRIAFVFVFNCQLTYSGWATT